MLEVTKPFEVVQILANLCSKEDINLLEAMKSLDNEHFKKDVFRNLNEFTFVQDFRTFIEAVINSNS